MCLEILIGELHKLRLSDRRELSVVQVELLGGLGHEAGVVGVHYDLAGGLVEHARVVGVVLHTRNLYRFN